MLLRHSCLRLQRGVGCGTEHRFLVLKIIFRNVCSCIQFLSSLFQIRNGFPPFLLALPRPGRGVIEVLASGLPQRRWMWGRSCEKRWNCRSTSLENLWSFESTYFHCQLEEAAPGFSIPYLSLVMGQTLGWEGGGSQILLVRSGHSLPLNLSWRQCFFNFNELIVFFKPRRVRVGGTAV